MEKFVSIKEIGNAYAVQLLIDNGSGPEERGKPVVVLDTAKDEAIGAAVRSLFRTRIRTKKEKKGEEAAA